MKRFIISQRDFIQEYEKNYNYLVIFKNNNFNILNNKAFPAINVDISYFNINIDSINFNLFNINYPLPLDDYNEILNITFLDNDKLEIEKELLKFIKEFKKNTTIDIFNFSKYCLDLVIARFNNKGEKVKEDRLKVFPINNFNINLNSEATINNKTLNFLIWEKEDV